MKREILFKGKRVDTNEWIFGDVYHGLNDCIYINTVVQIDDKSRCNKQIIVHPDTVCQFTGLLDKNGNKIFEGDKIKILNNKNGLAKVEFINQYVGGWNLVDIENEKISCSLGARHKEDLEITGNIHDETT